jgi:hypothetical protein
VLLAIAIIAVAAFAIAPAASAAASAHTLKLDSTMFAAQVGSTTTGGNVYAGALPDPTLGHGAVVFTAYGTTHLRVIFRTYFGLGSIKGTGRVTVAPAAAGGQGTFTGALNVTGGTGAYTGARGKLTVAGTIDSAGMLLAAIRGKFRH